MLTYIKNFSFYRIQRSSLVINKRNVNFLLVDELTLKCLRINGGMQSNQKLIHKFFQKNFIPKKFRSFRYNDFQRRLRGRVIYHRNKKLS